MLNCHNNNFAISSSATLSFCVFCFVVLIMRDSFFCPSFYIFHFTLLHQLAFDRKWNGLWIENQTNYLLQDRSFTKLTGKEIETSKKSNENFKIDFQIQWEYIHFLALKTVSIRKSCGTSVNLIWNDGKSDVSH